MQLSLEHLNEVLITILCGSLAVLHFSETESPEQAEKRMNAACKDGLLFFIENEMYRGNNMRGFK